MRHVARQPPTCPPSHVPAHLPPCSSCLQSQGLYTAEVDTGSLADERLGLRQLGGADCDGVSALESGVAPRLDVCRGVVDDQAGVVGSIVLPTMKQREAGSGRGAGDEAEARGEERGGAANGDAPGAGGGSRAQDGVGNEGGGGGQTQLQRLASGSAMLPQGMPSPVPHQQSIAPGVGSGSGGGSGHLPQPPLMSAPPPQQQQGQQGSHRLSGSLEARPALLGSGGSLPNAMHGSAHNSGSGGDLPSGSTAQQPGMQQLGQLALPPLQGGADPQVVAAAVAQLLQQGGIGAGMLAGQQQQQLAALLGAHSLQQQPPPAMAGGSMGPSSSLLLGPSSAALAAQQQQNGGLLAQQQQQQQQAMDEDMGEETDDDDEKPFLRPAPGAAQKYGQGNRVLTYDDLAAQVRGLPARQLSLRRRLDWAPGCPVFSSKATDTVSHAWQPGGCAQQGRANLLILQAVNVCTVAQHFSRPGE